MKIWASILFCFLFLSASSAFAQEAGMSDVLIVDDREHGEADKPVYAPGDLEARYIPRASGVYAPSDSLVLQLHDFPMQQAAQKPADKNERQAPKPKDDSILTFNFLYYIIQKYKLQDIID
jgi:hypothetical protein